MLRANVPLCQLSIAACLSYACLYVSFLSILISAATVSTLALHFVPSANDLRCVPYRCPGAIKPQAVDPCYGTHQPDTGRGGGCLGWRSVGPGCGPFDEITFVNSAEFESVRKEQLEILAEEARAVVPKRRS